ncbi:methylenetetrahydrofolate reductase [Halocynthiibacter styelae]|uniref:Methylenetetrahydrofolate reductase n=1 Tax=Halocynthiibacter styelae TaxID=2761955 RepID=A0A8J7IWT7_9RHOB|nr:methylenetetrahydrofolate reductase [Paenihalocynthiibacter styelae]MBI1493360.1 methylenetetrahydrofolate reductase [Paenihalocynthiibacter styelae]
MTRPNISFEFFPPKSLAASFRLWDTVQALAPLAPGFVSVTYGAGGTTRQLTHEAVTTIGKSTGLNVAAHLTCVDASRDETLEIAQTYAAAGVKEIVALRGDTPGAGVFEARPDGFGSSVELIEGLTQAGDFNIRVGAYPEAHPESTDMAQNIAWLKRKFEAGATSAITQFFFEPETFFRFRDACQAAGIDGDRIIPGVLPIENWKGTRKFAERCGTSIPADIAQAYDNAARDDCHDLLALAQCSELCSDLLDGGVNDLHFYTLNTPDLTRDCCRALGIEPELKLEKVA